MMLHIDLQSETPIYTQLTEQIMEGIASGQLQPGEALPSIRSLAGDLGINLHTVNKAYTLLKQEGYIQIHRYKGVIVQPDGMPEATPAFRERQKQQLKPIIAEAICRGITLEELQVVVRDIYEGLHTLKGE
ncbi:GntR family transcriptional regulator [Paenibacillus sp. YYML68]|uniref:GntR family transcriptional regulator n=1 Tax=Paenibacillus sp. YYML68 TaxID=2909250 RepID=UPI00248F9A87|nr:GntR family transcriptional regulator [Paenibacillus sp. YYML68]